MAALHEYLRQKISGDWKNDPHSILLSSIVDTIFLDSTPPSVEKFQDAEVHPYARNMLAISDCLRRSDTPLPLPPTRLEQSEDFLSNVRADWSAIKLTNYLLMRCLRPRNAACIVTTIRDEGVYVLEWVAYHLQMGFDTIVVYTNDNTDASLPLLRILDTHGIIHLIENNVAPTISPQQKCYEHSIHLLPLIRDYTWALYIDADEFFNPLAGTCVGDFLSKLPNQVDNGISAIYLNWKWFGSGGRFARPSGFVIDNYHSSRADTHGKSFVRLYDVLSMRPVHYPDLLPHRNICNSAFEVVSDINVAPPTYQKAQINHYWNKSFQEYAIKRARGRVSIGLNGTLRSFQNFFEWDVLPDRAYHDPINEYFISRAKEKYNALIAIPGIMPIIDALESGYLDRIREIDSQYDLRSIFDRQAR